MERIIRIISNSTSNLIISSFRISLQETILIGDNKVVGIGPEYR